MPHNPNYLILPSILSADMLNLGAEVNAVCKAGADMIHFDVMDNHYVSNLTIGPQICHQLRQKYHNIPIDVHLMATPVDRLIEQFIAAGATRISIHPDATTHLDHSLKLIRKAGCQAGIVLNPATNIDCLTWCEYLLDFVLVMTVNPGFGGQTLIHQMLNKISQIHQKYPLIPISVDGGVCIENIAALAQAGATQFVAGTAIFASDDYADTISAMREKLRLQC